MRGQVGLVWGVVQTDSLIARRDQPGASAGVRRREQRDIVTKVDQCVAQVRDHAFGASVEFGWDGFIQWSDLGNLHNGFQCDRGSDPRRNVA